MEVILREDVPGLGIIGEVVKVKRGYARNYLLPRGMAVVADRRNLKQLEHQMRVIAAKKTRERSTHERVAEAMEGIVLEIEGRAGKGGKLFGSVTNMDVHKLLKEKEFEIDRRRIDLKEPIKEIGEYDVSVRVGQDVGATVKVVVKPLGGELEDKSVDGEEEHEVVEGPKAAAAAAAAVIEEELAAAGEASGEEAAKESEDAGGAAKADDAAAEAADESKSDAESSA